jgi:hypothetical protein
MAQWSFPITHRVVPQPRHDPHEVHRDRDKDMLEVRPCKADIPAPSQIKPPCALGNRAFYPSSDGILLSKRKCMLPLTSGLERHVLLLRAH